MRDLLFVQRSTLFSTTIRLMSKCSYGRCGSFVRRCLRGCTVGYRDRCSECQLSYGPDRASGQSLEVSIRRAESGGRAAVFLALQGGRQLFSRDSRPYYQRRQCRRSREIAYGNAGECGISSCNAWNRVGSGFVAGGRMIYGHDGMAESWGMSSSNPEDGNAAADAVAVWKPMFLRRVPNGRPSS